MSIMNDIQYEVDSFIVKNGYCYTDNESKLKLVETGMKKYMIDKIEKIDSKVSISDEMADEVSLHELAEILGNKLPKENRNELMANLTRYIIGVAGFMQGVFVKWVIHEDPAFVTNPTAEINQNGRWDKLITHKQTPYLETFDLALENLKQVMKLKTKRDKELIKAIGRAS